MSPQEALDTKDGRVYTWKDGSRYVSVTTAIGDGVPKPGLARWFAKQVAEFAARNRADLAQYTRADDVVKYLLTAISKPPDSAAATGSRVHSIAEKISKGDTVSVEPDAVEAPYVTAFTDFLHDWKPVYVESEATVYNRQHGYAGTLDAIVEIGGKRYVLDIKTGKSVWPEAALQLAAYSHAQFIGRADGSEDELPACNRGLVLHLRPEGYQVVPCAVDDTVFNAFLSALDIHRWIREDSKYVIGGPWEL